MIRRSLVVIVLAITAALIGQAQDTATSSGQITMTAKKYEFSPNVIRVKKGDHVKLVITSLDREHGIKIEGYQIEQKLPKDEPVTIEFTADKAGTFPFKCSKFCGMGHGKMTGQLIVEE